MKDDTFGCWAWKKWIDEFMKIASCICFGKLNSNQWCNLWVFSFPFSRLIFWWSASAPLIFCRFCLWCSFFLIKCHPEMRIFEKFRLDANQRLVLNFRFFTEAKCFFFFLEKLRRDDRNVGSRSLDSIMLLGDVWWAHLYSDLYLW